MWLELWYLRLFFLFSLVLYSYWAVLVINRITTFLGINCLTIRKDRGAERDRAYREFGESGLPLNAGRDSIQIEDEDDGFKSH
jgi:ethanolaminephosphotransferase